MNILIAIRTLDCNNSMVKHLILPPKGPHNYNPSPIHGRFSSSPSFSLSLAMAEAATSASDSDTQLIEEELQELTQTLYQSHISSSSTTTPRTTSLALALPRTTDETTPITVDVEDNKFSSRARSRRMSLSQWRSRPKFEDQETEQVKENRASGSSEKKKGIWNWKPIRALSHIGMQKTTTLFSVEVVAAQGLPASMNGLRLSVSVRKKETKDGAVQTMPSRVSQGAADFEETLFVKCHVYRNKTMKFEPRHFLIYLFAVDAEELNFGTSSVDLSQLIEESVEKSYEGKRVRKWDRNLTLSGKARGGELVVKIGFQIMEKDGGVGIYGRDEGDKIGRDKTVSFSFARKHSKSSFSIPGPRIPSSSSSRFDARTPSVANIRGMDHLNDEPAPVPKTEDFDLPEFEVVDKGVEETEFENTAALERLGSSEVVKEMVSDQLHQLTRLTELDSIAKQIKALEDIVLITKAEEGAECQKLDADEETVTMEFLHLLEEEEEERKQCKLNQSETETAPLHHEDTEKAESSGVVYVPDLGKGLGCVVQTRNGGYLAAMNPLDALVSRKETPKLAMQISKPLVISTIEGLQLLRKMAGLGVDELSSQLLTLMPMDELIGKTAEQIAFEGIASAIIQGRNKEGATSSAARTVEAVKSMAAALTAGRKQRIATGIWSVAENEEDPVTTVEEIVAFSLQRIEAMAVEALKIQADMAEEDAPFEVSSIEDQNQNHLLMDTAVGSDDTASGTTVSVIVQLRDPLRRFEAVGGPVIALIQATRENRVDESRYRVTSVDVAGLMVRSGGRKSAWDGEKQRLTAMQWLVAYGLGKRRKRRMPEANVKGRDLVWSISSRVMADLWLQTMRNPDVKFAEY